MLSGTFHFAHGDRYDEAKTRPLKPGDVAIMPPGAPMFGYTREELVGQNVNILMPPPYRDEHDGYLARYLETGNAKVIGRGIEVEGRRKDGTVFPIDLAVSEVDHLGLFTGIVRDITERKAERERLIQSERLAALGEAMAGLTHESRNALQRIRASIDFLRLELETVPTAEREIRSIEQAAEDLRGLLEEVRSYAAPIKLDRTACNLQTIWRSAWRQLAPVRADRDATFVEETGKVDLTLSADAARLDQVFRNLFENSLAACDDPVRIEVSCAETPDKAGVEIRVRDNGPGLTPEQRAKVFDPFFTTKASGTGLGMAIVQRIIEAHQGTIRVEDNPHGGASFVLTIPRTS